MGKVQTCDIKQWEPDMRSTQGAAKRGQKRSYSRHTACQFQGAQAIFGTKPEKITIYKLLNNDGCIL
ncbi:hypothetical protein EF849_01340 [Aeromonas jandaei]|nr:hypothetical protein [Aeromonas jandaei]